MIRPKTDFGTPGEVHSVFGVKGGTGATTVSANLAVELRRVTGARVVLLELDLPLGDSAIHLGAEPRHSVYDLVQNLHRMDNALLSGFVTEHPSGLHILSAPYQPWQPGGLNSEQIRRILAILRQSYAFVVVDAPRLFSAGTLEAVIEADHVYLVTTTDTPAIRNLCRAVPVLDTLTPHEIRSRCRLIVNRDRKGQLLGAHDIEELTGLEVFGRLRDDENGVRRAMEVPEPVVFQRNGLGRDLHALAHRVAGRGTMPARRWGTGFFRTPSSSGVGS
jgi:pilus assembly protein CpaE